MTRNPLDRYLKASGRSGAALARRIGVDPSQISRWRRGAIPGLVAAYAMERATDGEVKASWWARRRPVTIERMPG